MTTFHYQLTFRGTRGRDYVCMIDFTTDTEAEARFLLQTKIDIARTQLADELGDVQAVDVHLMTDTKTCIYCGQAFEPPKPTTLMCRFCWYGGKHHEAQRPDLMKTLRSIDGIKSVDIDHTGGGCFGMGIRLTDGRFLFGTMAYQDNQTGEWVCESSLPDEDDERWALGIYPDDGDGFYSCEPLEDMRIPLTDDELIAAVRDIVKGGQR